MTVFRILAKPQLSICALAALVCLAAPARSAQISAQRPGAAGIRVEDSEQHAGPFVIAGQSYTVVLREKHLAGTSGSTLAQTLAGIEIRDAGGTVAYQEAFPYAIEQGRFQQILSASADIISGKTGPGLVLHYREQTQVPPTGAPGIAEFWQMFGLVNGKFAPLGKPTPIGEGATGGPSMGVMMRAANGTVSVIGQPDTIEVRVWTGAFYVLVPLRVDWSHGGLAQGQRCFEMMGGGNREVGCDMRVEGERKPTTEEFSFARVFVEADENMGEPEHVVVQKSSKVEILGSSAITTWNQSGELMQPVFSDLWLHVRIDNHSGWIHGDEDFAAVGLPRMSPAQ